jgi:hypothetical protein
MLKLDGGFVRTPVINVGIVKERVGSETFAKSERLDDTKFKSALVVVFVDVIKATLAFV